MALEGIGLVADFIGIFDGLTGLLDATSSSSSSSSDAETAHITIGVGTNVNGLSGADGDLPDARNFGIGGDFLGMVADPGSVCVLINPLPRILVMTLDRANS